MLMLLQDAVKAELIRTNGDVTKARDLAVARLRFVMINPLINRLLGPLAYSNFTVPRTL